MNNIETDDVFTGALQAVSQQIENNVNASGFDQPALLFGVKLIDSATALAAARKHDPEIGSTAPPDSLALAMQVEYIELGAGHPYDALKLIGNSLSEETVAVVLISEAWNYGPANQKILNDSGTLPPYPPSEDPDRVELRLVTAVGRDATTVCLRRQRHGELELVDSTGGRIVNAMRRTLGVASVAAPGDIAVTVADCDRRMKAHMLLSWITADHNGAVAHIDEHDDAGEAFARDWDALSPFSGATNWDDLLERLRDEPDARSEPLMLDSAFIEWTDGTLLSEELDMLIPAMHTLSQRLRELSHQHQWPDDFVAKIKAITDLTDL